MHASFWKAALTSVFTLSALLGVHALQPSESPRGQDRSWSWRSALWLMHQREISAESREGQVAGYYEGLLNQGSRVSPMHSLLTTSRRPSVSRFSGIRRIRGRLSDRYTHRGDFLYYEPKPNVNVPDYDDERLRLVTNSKGLSDREYDVQKPPGVWRIAVLGDSVTRGMGAPFGTSFDALLEERLNAEPLPGGIRRVEIINFAVSGYRITQLLEVALEKLPPYSPDVYVICLSELSSFRRWGEHFAQLVTEGIDLKYDFLKQVAREARLGADDEAATAVAKLAPHRLPTTRWVLTEIKDRAARKNASVVVLLMPTVRPYEVLEKEFRDTRVALGDLGIPVINLLDTFVGISDLNAYRVSEDNVHPNERGHQKLSDSLHGQMRSDPQVAAALLPPGHTTGDASPRPAR